MCIVVTTCIVVEEPDGDFFCTIKIIALIRKSVFIGICYENGKECSEQVPEKWDL